MFENYWFKLLMSLLFSNQAHLLVFKSRKRIIKDSNFRKMIKQMQDMLIKKVIH